MNQKLIINISKSLLLARWKQTLVAAIGVTFSITMFITLLSFMTGLNKLLDGLIINRLPHVKLYNEVKPSKDQPVNNTAEFSHSYNFIQSIKSTTNRQELYNVPGIINYVKQDPRVLGYAPRLVTQVFFNDGSIDISAVINGVNAEAETKLYHFADYITAGSPIDLDIVTNSIILGKPLAEKLLANIGDVVQISTSRGERFSLKVVGFFQSGIQDFDKVQSYASIATTQKIMGEPANYLTEIDVKLHDVNQAPATAKQYRQLFDCDVEDIQTANSQFETGTFIRTLISYTVGIVLLTVAGFGIYNILNMMIYEKMDTIAILKATGFSGGDVRRMFLFIALSIGLFGGLFGLVFGFSLSAIIHQVPFNTPALPTVKTYPINYNPVYYFIAIIFSLTTTYLAGFFPARKASKVDPVVIIRGK
jgi:lipoprotein-releasing system permease protein